MTFETDSFFIINLTPEIIAKTLVLAKPNRAANQKFKKPSLLSVANGANRQTAVNNGNSHLHLSLMKPAKVKFNRDAYIKNNTGSAVGFINMIISGITKKIKT